MADIFISYSSHDREKAEQLTELLDSNDVVKIGERHPISPPRTEETK
jgi:hypothetical protein